MTNLVYIFAASHSGSTLLAMLLGAHPDICTVGELKATSKSMGAPDRYRCSCGTLIRECRFWQTISDGMAMRGFQFDITDAGTDFRSSASAYARKFLGPLHRDQVLERFRDAALWLSPTWRGELARIQRKNTAMIRTIGDVTGAKVIVDSSKTALRLKYLLRNPGIDVKIIRLIRDGRGVALTYVEERQISMAKAACEWRRGNEAAENLLRGIDRTRWIETRYEDLCADPDGVLTGLFNFIGVDPTQAVRDFRAVEQHVVGNNMRLSTSSEIKLDEQWKEVLTDERLDDFDRIAGELSRRYGYPPSHPDATYDG